MTEPEPDVEAWSDEFTSDQTLTPDPTPVDPEVLAGAEAEPAKPEETP